MQQYHNNQCIAVSELYNMRVMFDIYSQEKVVHHIVVVVSGPIGKKTCIKHHDCIEAVTIVTCKHNSP